MQFNSPSDHRKHSSIFSSVSSGASHYSPETDERLVDTTILNSSVNVYIEDQCNVDPDKLMPYMFMLGRGVHQDIPKDIDISSVELLNKALDMKVLKKKVLVLSKPMIMQVLRRRNLNIKLNAKNKKIEDLFEMIDKSYLNEGDKNHINTTISQYLEEFARATEEAESKSKVTGQWIEATDPLHWMMAINVCGDICEHFCSNTVCSIMFISYKNSCPFGYLLLFTGAKLVSIQSPKTRITAFTLVL